MVIPRGDGRVVGSRGRGKPRKCRDRRVATFDEVVARNEEYERREREANEEGEEGKEDQSGEEERSKQKETQESKANAENGTNSVDEEGESEEESEESSEDEASKPRGISGFSTYNPNHENKPIEKTGVEISRRLREQMERQNRDERIDALRTAGKTEQSRADLERLAEVRKRREEAAKRRDAQTKEKKQIEEAKLSKKMGKTSLG